jgi:hypothetical protein
VYATNCTPSLLLSEQLFVVLNCEVFDASFYPIALTNFLRISAMPFPHVGSSFIVVSGIPSSVRNQLAFATGSIWFSPDNLNIVATSAKPIHLVVSKIL